MPMSTTFPFFPFSQLAPPLENIYNYNSQDIFKKKSIFLRDSSHLFSALGIIPKKGVADFVQSSLLSHRPAKIPSLFYAREARRATNSKDVAGVPLTR